MFFIREPLRACRKSGFLKNCFFCWIKNRELFSAIESSCDPWCKDPISMIFFLPQYPITQSRSAHASSRPYRCTFRRLWTMQYLITVAWHEIYAVKKKTGPGGSSGFSVANLAERAQDRLLYPTGQSLHRNRSQFSSCLQVSALSYFPSIQCS